MKWHIFCGDPGKPHSMILKNTILLTLLALTICSCKKETCTVTCDSQGTIYFVVVGYSRSELAGVIRQADNYTDTMPLSMWHYPSVNDTTSDTLIAGAVEINYGVGNFTTSLIFPTTNDTVNITDMVLHGTVTEQLPCHEGGHIAGSPVGPGCNAAPYLYAYKINGNQVTLPARNNFDTVGYIYIHK